MDEKRWPTLVRELVDSIGVACDPCEVVIDVQQIVIAENQEHFGWLIAAYCAERGTGGRWEVHGNAPVEPTEPEQVPEQIPGESPVPEPAWYGRFSLLPPGASA